MRGLFFLTGIHGLDDRKGVIEVATVLDPIRELEADHRQVRDILLDLIEAGRDGDGTKALELLLVLDKLGGPHFRFEEESLYPALAKFFGQEYYEYLLGVHDRIIRSAKVLAGILGDSDIGDGEAAKLADIVRNEILPHPIECDGLTLLTEKLSAAELDAIAANLEASRQAGIPLLEWADTVRDRKV